MTILELTALSYAFVIVVISICWYHMPAISQSRDIPTKNNKIVDEIRGSSKETDPSSRRGRKSLSSSFLISSTLTLRPERPRYRRLTSYWSL
ncbi:hypothetical protein BJ170DRAFT_73522 [Xylariales sp. AK1849]|nr:hypothetical protein BJ170DRAFT_73522 [Xylariales sp. AK1849]